MVSPSSMSSSSTSMTPSQSGHLILSSTAIAKSPPEILLIAECPPPLQAESLYRTDYFRSCLFQKTSLSTLYKEKARVPPYRIASVTRILTQRNGEAEAARSFFSVTPRGRTILHFVRNSPVDRPR